jgi:hypothetical protein
MNIRVIMLFVAGILSLPTFGFSQQREREPGRWTGKLKGVGPGGVLQVQGDKGEQWLVAVEARPQDISYQGSSTQAFLRPGMLVQFNASLDKKGEAQEPISELKVVSQRMGIQLGLQAGGSAGAGLFNSADDEGKKKKKVRTDASYQVTGTLRSIKDGKIYVAAGTTVKAELTNNCQVSIDVADVSLAREGDTVEIGGWRYANQANQLYARNLTITADKPLGSDEKKRRTPAKGDEKKTEEKKSDEKAPARKADAAETKNPPK